MSEWKLQPCCEAMENAIADNKIIVDEKSVDVAGCCGNCVVLANIYHCPYCGRPFIDAE